MNIAGGCKNCANVYARPTAQQTIYCSALACVWAVGKPCVGYKLARFLHISAKTVEMSVNVKVLVSLNAV